MQGIVDFFRELTRNLRVADFFDIALVSIFIYSAIIWFKRTTSRSIVIGISVLTLVYFLARKFDLFLTSLFFQTIFAVLLVALVVVFQEEIRRGFERIAVWGSLRDRRRSAPFPGVDTLMESVGTLAADRIGALIVIRGKEPLDRHVEGGIPLQGRISKPLLCSIFDPHSPGHDGAVLIEGDRVAKFGAHLPLSKNLSEVGTLGTRHAAALGLSERTDCFVIAISEERGTVTTAENGSLRKMGSVAELKDRLERFYAESFPSVPQEARGDWKRLFRENARIKILSIALACFAWFMLAYRAETIQRTFAVPIEYRNLPVGWVLEGRKPAEAMVTLSGSERAFALLEPSKFVLSIDLSRVQEGQERFVLSEEYLKRPSNLQVYRIEPNVITLQAYPVVVTSLPVEVQTMKNPPKGFRLVGMKVSPTTVRVQARRSFADHATKVLTEPILLSDITQTTMLRARLMLPEYLELLDPSVSDVRVTVEVVEDRPEGQDPVKQPAPKDS